MTLIPYLVAYVAIGVFLVAVAARIAMWLRMPIHVRWELYPVPHTGARARYGGSHLEDTDWWKKPIHKSHWGEIKAMVPEILFLVALKENNPKMWRRSFPFHFGVYLVALTAILLIKMAVLGALFPSLLSGGLGTFLQYVCLVCALAGLVLGIAGAIGLLQQRLTDPELKDFTAPADIFNLVFFVVAFAVALLHLLLVDRSLSQTQFFVHNLVTFRMGALPATFWFTTATVVLLGLLVAYIPLTHMSHFIGKYFAYHAIRWNDTPNLPGSGSDRTQSIQQVLSYPVSWSAPHIEADGKKTWADVATKLPEEEKKK